MLIVPVPTDIILIVIKGMGASLSERSDMPGIYFVYTLHYFLTATVCKAVKFKP